MKFRNLLILNAIVLGISGILALLFPTSVLSLYGVGSGPAVQLMAQYAGLGSLAIALVAWFIRDVKDLKAQYAVTMAFLIIYMIGAIVSVLGTISGTMKSGWAVVGFYFLFAIGYSYILLLKKSS
jgi:hypothetical protein